MPAVVTSVLVLLLLPTIITSRQLFPSSSNVLRPSLQTGLHKASGNIDFKGTGSLTNRLNIYSSERDVPFIVAKNDPVSKFSDAVKGFWSKILSGLRVIWDFSRPHTLIGSALSILCLNLYALPANLWFTSKFLKSVGAALVPSLLANIYITGLNQITDIDIDRINKPYLPIAAGRLSKNNAIGVVSFCLAASLLLISKAVWPLQSAVVGSSILGTLYSLPPFRFKKYPLLAAFCITVVRGSLINLGFIFHSRMNVLGEHISNRLSDTLDVIKSHPDSFAITTFFAVYGLVIALMKDVPDIKGDTEENIQTFSVRMGAKKMFKFSCALLQSLLLFSAGGMLSAAFRDIRLGSSGLELLPRDHIHFGRVVAGLSLSAFAYLLKRDAKTVDTNDPKDIFKYYMQIWKVFYSCYLLLVILPFSKPF